MIYVHRDLTKITKGKLARLKSLSEELEQIEGKADRKAFIAANAKAWSDVRDELAAMSFRKCWYTESREAVSRYQTDHFRPHGRVKQADKEFAEGYCWLAFDIENFRIVGVLANTQNREYSEETVGKGIWFPLADPSRRATLVAKTIGGETPLLLDPTDLDDPQKIEFNDNGEAHPAAHLDDETKEAIDLAIVRMGIRQEMLNEERRKKWRDCARTIDKYDRFIRKPKGDRSEEERQTIDELAQELITMASADSEFSATARSCLQSRRLSMFIVRDELNPLKLV
jgi:hypothetical protein